jgi:urease accessory protein
VSGALRAGLALLLLCAATPASAHMPIAGVGGFYGGLVHPILVPAHALSVLALGLLIGGRSDRAVAMIVFAVALAGGLIALTFAIGETAAADVLLADTALIGLIVAAAWQPPHLIVWLLAAISGAALALDSPPDAITIEEGNAMLLGTWLGAAITLAAVIELVVRLTRAWQRIGVRVAGSWIAASAMLVLAVRFAAGDLPKARC